MNLTMRNGLQAAAWLLAAAILVLSVVPPALRPTTSISHSIEHFLIFFAVGLCFGLSYRIRHFLLLLALVTYAGSVELLQLLVPGRHARLRDFVINAFGLCVGVGLAALVKELRNRRAAT
jgi:VanZ family protein